MSRLIRIIATLLGVVIVTPFVTLELVLSVGGLEGATPACADAAFTDGSRLAIGLAWLRGLWTAGYRSWSCQENAILLHRVLESLALLGTALVLSLALAILATTRSVRSARDEGPRKGRGALLWMAPTILWATGISVVFNMAAVQLKPLFPDSQLCSWLFPLAPAPVRWCAAVCTLALGSGTLWELRTGLRQDLEQVRQAEFEIGARANGLPTRALLFRNLLSPTLARIAGRVPFLAGEIIVVEYVFMLDALGRELVALAEDRDAPALMTVTLLLAAVTMGLRSVSHLVTARLHPPRLEEQAA